MNCTGTLLNVNQQTDAHVELYIVKFRMVSDLIIWVLSETVDARSKMTSN